MVQNTVTCSCGHPASVTVPHGKYRWRRVERMRETGLCSDCREERFGALNRRAAEINAKAGLPLLTGTEKQIGWAESIRARALASPNNSRCLADLSPGANDPSEVRERLPVWIDRVLTARTRLEQETSAAWWIDNRYDVDAYVIRARAEAAREIFADVIERRAREQREAVARETAEREQQARIQAEMRQREAEDVQARIASVAAKAQTFVPASVDFNPMTEELTITGADGRTATGWIFEGDDWAVCSIDGEELPSTHDEAERIAADARAAYARSRAR